MAALGYELVQRCEVDSLYPFKLRCFDVKALSPRNPRKRAREEVCLLQSDDDGDGVPKPGSSKDERRSTQSRATQTDVSSRA